MTTTDIARRADVELAQLAAAPLQRLDPYAEGGIAAQSGRLAPLAVVSLGYRQKPKAEGQLGLPRATRREDEDWLHLHDPDGRAPGLKAALEAGKHRRLQIAFPTDRGFIQQSFTRWSASALEIYGDASGLRVIDGRSPDGPVHKLVTAGHPDFARLVKTCKAETRIYFALAHWLPDFGPDGEPQSEVLFPDGFGFYCFRTAGRHTAAEIMGYLESISGFTNGRIAGIPFDLDVVFREVVGPDGKKRVVPIANIVVRPPEHIKLNSRTFRQLATAGLEEGRNLQLPALPSPEALALEGPPDIEDIPDETLARLTAGDSACDYNAVVRTWHAIVRGTPLESDEARAHWLRGWSEATLGARDAFNTLTAVRALTHGQATQLLADLADCVSDVREELDRARQRELAALHDRIFGTEQEAENAGIPMRKAVIGRYEPPAETDDAQGAPSRADERSPEPEHGVEAADSGQVRKAGRTREGMVGVRSPEADLLGDLHEHGARVGLDLEPFKVQYPAPRSVVIDATNRLRTAIDAEESRQAGTPDQPETAVEQIPF